MREGGREGGKEGGREGGRDGGSEEGGREGRERVWNTSEIAWCKSRFCALTRPAAIQDVPTTFPSSSVTSIPSLSSWYLISIELRVLAAAAYGREGGKEVTEKKEEGRKGTGIKKRGVWKQGEREEK